jgi:hypothetical protein
MATGGFSGAAAEDFSGATAAAGVTGTCARDAGGAGFLVASSISGSGSATGGGSVEFGMASELETWIIWPHLRHFIRTERPATFSSAIWYFALQLGQRNFIQPGAVGVGQVESGE